MYEEHFYESVVGLTFDERKNMVSKLFEGEALTLRWESHNPYHDNTIMMLRENCRHLGNIRKDLAEPLVPLKAAQGMDTVDAYVVSVSIGFFHNEQLPFIRYTSGGIYMGCSSNSWQSKRVSPT